MLLWDKKLKDKLVRAARDIDGWKLYDTKRCVDDENGQSEAFPLGTRLVRDKLVIKQDKVQEDMGVPNDARVANIIKQIADKICPFIKVNVDYPSNHPSGYMPILDIDVAVESLTTRYSTGFIDKVW